MSDIIQALETAVIREHCKLLHLPTVAASCERHADEAVRERYTHMQYLDALLGVELQDQLTVDYVYRTRAEARAHLFEYIEIWYNRQRRHSSLGYLSPTEFEQKAVAIG